jgi:creatinine amidohydrolase
MSGYEFAKLRWPEVNAAAEAGKVALIPAATIEDHGLHLPVDTDVVIAEAVTRRAAEVVPNDVVLLPCVTFGHSPHHIDGPGTLTIRWDTFVEYVHQIACSLSYHGFYKILIVNAHGSNRPLLDIAARLTIVENPDVHCAMLSWWDLRTVRDVVSSFRSSEWTGHACELETSMYLAIDSAHVRMDLARQDVNPWMSRHFWSDLVDQAPVGFGTKVLLTEYWSTVTETGTWGDPTTATAEKGHAMLTAAAQELAEIILELKERPVRPRVARQTDLAAKRNETLHGPVPRFTV